MPGRVFLGRYQTIRILGEGGMGKVYLAHQLDLDRQVVVKVMHDHIAADTLFRERFTRETLLMARFQHPYAVTLFDASLNDPLGPCIVMEYIRGQTLDSLVQGQTRLPPARVARLLRHLCEALQAAHSLGIIHRDLKPANLMIVDAGTPYEILKVMDFGLAKLILPNTMAKLTATNTEFAVGTPGYMCPEQARGEEMDHRGDLYSVGVILFEMLTGRLPFAGRSTMDMLLAHATEEPPTFARIGLNGQVPPAIEALVQACLAKEPAERPSCARELADRFEAALQTLPAGTERPPERALLGPPRLVPVRLNGVAPVPAPAVANSVTPPPSVPAALPPVDPVAVVHHLEAWMPETIATYKLNGFIHDSGGEVLENIPGRIRVRLGAKGSVYNMAPRGLSWLLGRRSNLIDMELRLQRADSTRDNHLRIMVLLRPSAGDLSGDMSWHQLCSQIFCDLRGYLMGQTGSAISVGE